MPVKPERTAVAGSRQEVTIGRERRRRSFSACVEGLESRELLTTYTWTGTTSGSWSVGSNWSGKIAPPAAANADLVFPPSASNMTMVDNIPNLTVNSISFANAYTVTGDGSSSLAIGAAGVTANGGITVSSTNKSVTFDPSSLVLTGSTPISLAAGTTLNFMGKSTGGSSNGLKGTGDLNVSGSGNFVYIAQSTTSGTASQTYTGSANITGGKITIGTSTTIKKVTLATGTNATVGLTGGGSVTATFMSPDGSGGISGNGSVNFAAVGTGSTCGLVVDSLTDGTYDFETPGTVTATTISGGYYTLGSGVSLNAGSLVNSPDFVLDSATLTTANPGSATFEPDNASTVTFDNTANVAYSGGFSSPPIGAVHFTEAGPGTTTLGPYNDLSNGGPIDVTVSGGRLALGKTASPLNSVYLGLGGTLDLNGNALTVTNLSGVGTIALTGANLTASGTYGGSTSGSGGLIITNSLSLTPYQSNTFANTGDDQVTSGTLSLYGVTLAGRVDLGSATLATPLGTSAIGSLSSIGTTTGTVSLNAGLSVGSDGTSSTFAGYVAGSASNFLTKTGSGTLTLTNLNANTYANTLQVGGGTAFLNPLSSGTPIPVQVNSGGTFRETSGVSTINVASGGTLGPGTPTTPGTLITGGNVTLNPGSTFAVRININGNDIYISTANGPTMNITNANLAVSLGIGEVPPLGAPYTLISTTRLTGTFAGLPNNAILAAGGYAFRITYPVNGTTTDVVITRVSLSTTVGVSSSPSKNGRSVAFTASLATASGAPAPTGSVQFQVDGSNFGTPVIIVNGSATSTATTGLSAGGHTIEAIYSGDSNYSATTSATTTVRIVNNVAGDFDGDGKSDVGIYDQTTSTFYVSESGGGSINRGFGNPNDVNITVSGDFDGDGKADIGIYDQTASAFIVLESGGGSINRGFGNPNDVNFPVSGDFDGDGKSDVGIYDQTASEFIILLSGGGAIIRGFGNPADKNFPVSGDFDGDGKSDVGIYDQTASMFIILESGGGSIIRGFGNPADKNIPISGDFDGDGKADLGIYDQTTSNFIVQESGGGTIVQQFGNPADGDIPLAVDLDGDGQTDLVIYDEALGEFFAQESGGGTLALPFGTKGHANKPI
jgi:hypothetical protein